METKRVTHPVDLFDREGFLRFLNDQARKGWAVQEIGTFSSTFQKTDTPPRGYTMAYDRDKVWPYENQEGYHIVPCSLEGFAVYPTDELVLPDPTWPEQVLDDHIYTHYAHPCPDIEQDYHTVYYGEILSAYIIE